MYEISKECQLFIDAVDYLVDNGFAAHDGDVGRQAKLGQNTISRIRNGKQKSVTPDTIHKLIEAFQCINIDYLRGKSKYITCRLAAEAEMEKELKETRRPLDVDLGTSSASMASEPAPAPFIPTWADSLIDIMTQQIKQNEALNRELRKSISDMHLLMSEVTTTLSDLTEIIKKLT